MMRFIPVVLAGLVATFALQSLGRTLYINHYEFWPAAAEWHAAHNRGDLGAQATAYHKEEIAHCRTIDPLWFYQPWANECP